MLHQLLGALIAHNVLFASWDARLARNFCHRRFERHILSVLIASTVEAANDFVTQTVLFSIHEQPAAMSCIRPRAPILIRRAFLFPHPLHRSRPAVAAPSALVVSLVILTIGSSARVDHERVIMHHDLGLWTLRQELCFGIVKAHLCQVTPGSGHVCEYVNMNLRHCDYNCRYTVCVDLFIHTDRAPFCNALRFSLVACVLVVLVRICCAHRGPAASQWPTQLRKRPLSRWQRR